MFFQSVFILIFGLVIGSFLNALTWRLPRKQSLRGRSRCVHCGRILLFEELVPVLSFIFLKGKCRGCGRRIAWRYPAVELTAALLFYVFWLLVQPQTGGGWLELARFWLLAVFCLIVFIVDLEHYLILDSVVFSAWAVFAILNFVSDAGSGAAGFNHSLSGLFGLLVGVLPFFAIWFLSAGKLMGFGDVKLMLPLGTALGWPGIGVAIFFAVFTGSLIGVSLILRGKGTLKSPLPFGSFLACGALFAAAYGPNVVSWYLSILGL